MMHGAYNVKMRDQISRPYKTAGKTVVQYVLILYSEGEDKMFWTEQDSSRHSLNLVFSYLL